MQTRKRLIGVIGSSVGTPEQLEQARVVGRLIAQRGAVLLCGGMTGVMTAAAQGAQESGGLTIGILPGANAAESPPNEFIAYPAVYGAARGAQLSNRLRERGANCHRRGLRHALRNRAGTAAGQARRAAQ
jgi:predicted Rossmann-fold nucleotide-binding protein